MKEKHLQMYMRIAEAVAETSSAVRLKVGAVAVKNNMVIGTGYNGLPSGVSGSCEVKYYQDFLQDISPRKLEDSEFPYSDEEGKFKLVTRQETRHGEKNLLLNLAKSTESSNGAVIFCTHACCKYCAMDIVDSGVEKFYYRHEYRDSSGVDYLLASGIEVERI